AYLDELADRFNVPGFIDDDPVSIPHEFSQRQDIEIVGLFAAVLAWGQRGTIIKKCRELMDRMDRTPYAFIRNHSDSDLRRLVGFRHRTFNDTDLLYFRSEEHTSELQSRENLVCRLLLEKKNKQYNHILML